MQGWGKGYRCSDNPAMNKPVGLVLGTGPWLSSYGGKSLDSGHPEGMEPPGLDPRLTADLEGPLPLTKADILSPEPSPS